MQADNIQEGIKDLANKLVQLDSIEAHSAINQYFDTRAVLSTIAVNVDGSDRIKKQLDLFNHAFAKSELVGKPKYDKTEGTVNFTFSRTVQGPTLPIIQSLPIVYRLSQAKQTVHYDTVLHLNPDSSDTSEDGTPSLLVTKAEIYRREKAPLENLVPYTLMKPLLSIVSNIIATVATIVLSFPFTPKGLLYMAGSIIHSFVLWMYDRVAGVAQKRFPASPEWQGSADTNLPGEFVWKTMQAVTSRAMVLESNVEQRAKGYGIPVDQYKSKVTDIASEVIEKGQNAIENIQYKAQGATQQAQKKAKESEKTVKDKAQDAYQKANETIGQQGENAVQEGKKMAEKGEKKVKETVDVAAQKADETVKAGKETAEKAQEEIESTQQPTTDDRAEEDSLPQTPLGGTDPTSDHAPSFAAMAAEPANEQVGSKVKNDSVPVAPISLGAEAHIGDDYESAQIPRTPLGGTDPLANNAPSFAQAVALSTDNEYYDDKFTDQLPQTPLGGSDPLTNNAPSFAQAVAHYPDEFYDDESADRLPQTPLGGTDPLASGAPSYAQASAE